MNTESTSAAALPAKGQPSAETADSFAERSLGFAKYLGPVLLLTALWLLRHLLEEHSFRDIESAAQAISSTRLREALCLIALNYLVLTGYDRLALRSIGVKLAAGRSALASFISFTFSYNLGFAVVSGGAVRFRFYSLWGLRPAQIAHIIGFSGLFFWLGLCLLGALALLVDPTLAAHSLHLPTHFIYALAGVLLLPVIAVAWTTAKGKREIQIGRFRITIPSPELSFGALLVACADWLLAAFILYILMPTQLGISFPHFLIVFLISQLTGVLSHVPGGLGVFETTMVALLHSPHATSGVLAALLMFRAIYYLAPFMLGIVMLVAYETRLRARAALPIPVKAASAWVGGIIALGFAFAVFAAGTVLLLSGSIPVSDKKLHWITLFVPLPLLELSHFLSSIMGVVLLLLAWGLYKRVNLAYRLTLGALLVATLLSIPKRAEFTTTIYLAVLLAALFPTRHFFYRKAAAFRGFSWSFLASILCVLAVSTWLGFFSFKHIEYRHALWWEFAVSSDAPRFLRASLGIVVLLLCTSAYQLLKPAPPQRELPSKEDLAEALPIVLAQPSTHATLALLGDKQLLFDEDRSGFVMYAIEGKSWVALGDPVGPPETQKTLTWQFMELSDAHDGSGVFYQVSSEYVDLYLSIGLQLIKLGEEALVPLAEFTLEGSKAKELRNIRSKFERAEITFELVPASETAALIPELKSISEEWLSGKNVREKGFSVGFFDEDYLKKFPVALVKQRGEILAFANVLKTDHLEEVSIDLMRHRTSAPNGCMDFLFLQLMLWAKGQGFKHFSLGMAPLAGLETHRLAPLWNRVGSYLFTHGEHFYNFEGLRAYKSKFYPQWHPRYLAFPAKASLPRVLINIASLISGGLAGIVRR